jgi:hypothetical protein
VYEIKETALVVKGKVVGQHVLFKPRLRTRSNPVFKV